MCVVVKIAQSWKLGDLDYLPKINHWLTFSGTAPSYINKGMTLLHN